MNALLALLVLLLAGNAVADTIGAFNISVDGVQTRFYAVSQAWQARFFDASPGGGRVALRGGGGSTWGVWTGGV